MSTFTQIKANIRTELGDSIASSFSQQDIDDSVQDAYNEVVCLSQCIIKKVSAISFQANLNYYDMTTIVTDYLATTAIFSNLTNLWLLDDKTIKDFDKDRIDWELWTGSPIWWAPCNDAKRIAMVPRLTTATGTFDLYYWATAPTIINSSSPLVPLDFHNLIEIYSIADLLESYEEFNKAHAFWEEFWGISDGEQNFDQGIYALAARSKNIAKSDLTLLA